MNKPTTSERKVWMPIHHLCQPTCHQNFHRSAPHTKWADDRAVYRLNSNLSWTRLVRLMSFETSLQYFFCRGEPSLLLSAACWLCRVALVLMVEAQGWGPGHHLLLRWWTAGEWDSCGSAGESGATMAQANVDVTT